MEAFGILGNESGTQTASGGLPPWEIDPTTQGVHTGSGVLSVLCLNVLLCIGTMPVWVFLLKRLPIYQTSGAAPDVWLWRACRNDGVWLWLKNILDPAPFEQIARFYGTDTALYLAFLKLLTLGAAALCIPAAVVLPIHLYAAGGENMTEVVETADNRTLLYWENELFTRHTVQTVQDSPGVLCVHVAGIVFQTMVTLWLVGVFRRTAKRIFNANDPAESSLARRSIKVRRFPPEGVSEEDLFCFYNDMFPGQVEGAYIAYDVRDRIDMFKRLQEVQLRLRFESTKPVQEEETMDRLRHREEGIMEEIRLWHESPPDTAAGFAHVVFATTTTQLRALRQRWVTLPGSDAPVELKSAHHPRDINWDDVGRPASRFRAAVINFALVAGLIFLSTPAAIFSTLQRATERIPGISKIFGEDADGEDQDSTFDALLFQYLPVVSYLLLALCLPLVIEWVSGKQAVASRFRKRKLVMNRLYAYQMLCTFILPSIALSTIMALVEVFQGGQSDRIVRRSVTHLFLPNSGAFFFNVLSVYASLGNWWELWRPIELCKYLNCLYQKKFDPTEEWGTWVMEFEFHWHYPLLFVSWAIAFNYAVFIPFIAPALWVLCYVKFRIHASHARSNMMFRRNALDAAQFGKMVKTLVTMWVLSMLICLAFATAFFMFREERPKFYLHISVIGFLCMYVAYLLVGVVRASKNTFVHELPRGGGSGFVMVNCHGEGASDVEEEDEFDEVTESEQSADRVVTTHASHLLPNAPLNEHSPSRKVSAHGELEAPTHISFAFTRPWKASDPEIGDLEASAVLTDLGPRNSASRLLSDDSPRPSARMRKEASIYAKVDHTLYAAPFFHLAFNPDQAYAGQSQLARTIGSAAPSPTSTNASNVHWGRSDTNGSEVARPPPLSPDVEAARTPAPNTSSNPIATPVGPDDVEVFNLV
eukprot:TRINITY_DN6711_c1_g5_i1.p1 TRINITY_DN6711_c1_g5~~TRINITY_DN6711_c1_g5_i1.p1  ORF type:complete len:931 (+),score=224.62 TRINITY_DN6711_c1_g5_i1:61-2853(+)